MTLLFADYYAGLIGAGVALFVGIALVLSKRFHGRFTLDHHIGVQKVHSDPTPRIGGLAILAGFIAAWYFSTGEARTLLALIGLTGLPALGFGMAEDITKKVGVKWRLLATIFSGLIFTIASGYSISSVGVPWLDVLLSYSWVAIPFTAFAIGGVANSINLIDGFHGLASGTLMVIFLAFAIVYARVGDSTMVVVSITMLLIIAGFFVVNFPLGKLFLGDAGAYFTGYMVAVLGVLLPARHAEVSPWVSLLILGYPVMETVFSILRRQRDGHSPGAPDSDHLHHLVHRRWATPMSERLNIILDKNALTSVFLWGLPIGSLLAATFTNLESSQPLLLLGVGVLLYIVVYRTAYKAPV
ncbi:MAG: glycosyltransferase family 4 protein [Rhodobacteraceae bacterium]|nr:glycosyltransferase family 4 protein [Paracoccaceae bacterium]